MVDDRTHRTDCPATVDGSAGCLCDELDLMAARNAARIITDMRESGIVSAGAHEAAVLITGIPWDSNKLVDTPVGIKTVRGIAAMIVRCVLAQGKAYPNGDI